MCLQNLIPGGITLVTKTISTIIQSLRDIFFYFFCLWTVIFEIYLMKMIKREKHRRCVILIAMQKQKTNELRRSVLISTRFFPSVRFHFYYDNATTLLFFFRCPTLGKVLDIFFFSFIPFGIVSELLSQ